MYNAVDKFCDFKLFAATSRVECAIYATGSVIKESHCAGARSLCLVGAINSNGW